MSDEKWPIDLRQPVNRRDPIHYMILIVASIPLVTMIIFLIFLLMKINSKDFDQNPRIPRDPTFNEEHKVIR